MRIRQPHCLTRSRLVTKHQPPLCRPIREHLVEFHEFSDVRNVNRATLLRRLYGMRLRPIDPKPLRIGELRRNRHNPTCTHFHGLLHNKLSLRLF